VGSARFKAIGSKQIGSKQIGSKQIGSKQIGSKWTRSGKKGRLSVQFGPFGAFHDRFRQK
jgi:hypothetical protein